MKEAFDTYILGEPDETMFLVKLMAQSIGVLIGGIVLWRLGNLFMRKASKKRQQSNYFERKHKEHWKS